MYYFETKCNSLLLLYTKENENTRVKATKRYKKVQKVTGKSDEKTFPSHFPFWTKQSEKIRVYKVPWQGIDGAAKSRIGKDTESNEQIFGILRLVVAHLCELDTMKYISYKSVNRGK